MAEWLDRWTWPSTERRVTCVEPEGPRRTWVLTEGGRQCGHVRMRWLGTMTENVWTPANDGSHGVVKRSSDLGWTVEASDRARAALGLDTEAGPGQTGGHG